MINVLIVDDSRLIREILSRVLSSDPGIKVAGEAEDGKDAIDKTISLKPDVIVMDIIMPGVDGLWALEEIMRQQPTPVVIVSSIGVENSDIFKEAFAIGVVDVVFKESNIKTIETFGHEVIQKVKAASKISGLKLLEFRNINRQKNISKLKANHVVVIATSAGGPPSLYEVIQRFSKDFYGGIVVAQHMPAYAIHSFADHIQKLTSFDVKVAEKGDILYSRRILFSPTNATLELIRTKKGAVCEITNYKSRLQPDINKVIISCAEAFKAQTVLVVLSGLGTDGVIGAQVVKSKNGFVLVESKLTAGIHSGMPESVIESGYYDIETSSYNMSQAVENYFAKKPVCCSSKTFVLGVVIKSTINFIKGKYPKSIYNEILSKIPRDLKMTIDRGIDVYRNFPGSFYIDMMKTVYEIKGKTENDIVCRMAEQNACDCIEMFKISSKINRIEDIVNYLKQLQKTVFTGFKIEVKEFNQNKNKMLTVFSSIDYSKDNISIIKMIAKGWAKGILRAAKKDIKDMNAETVEKNGSYIIKLHTTWE